MKNETHSVYYINVNTDNCYLSIRHIYHESDGMYISRIDNDLSVSRTQMYIKRYIKMFGAPVSIDIDEDYIELFWRVNKDGHTV